MFGGVLSVELFTLFPYNVLKLKFKKWPFTTLNIVMNTQLFNPFRSRRFSVRYTVHYPEF